jgi:hypothetical protein
MLALEFPLAAQYPGGGYPGGGYPYPGSRYPTGSGMPIPRRSKGKTTDAKTPAEPTRTMSGIVQQINDASITIVAQDTRTITAKLSGKTKFLNKGEATTAANFSAGDHVRIDASQDEQGFYHAVTVALDKKGTTADRAAIEDTAPPSLQKSSDQQDERPVLRRNPAAAAAEPAAEKAETSSKAEVPAEKAEPEPERESATRVVDSTPDCFDAEEPGRPILRRGKPAPRKPAAGKTPCAEPVARPEPQEVASATAPQWKTAPSDAAGQAAPPSAPQEDPKIAKARESVSRYTQSLPNYFCQQQVARFASVSSPKPDWQPLDVISAVVVHENGKDNYSNIAVNGKPVKKKMDELGGTWSTGEFGMMAADLFSPATAADFNLVRSTSIAGRDAVVYDFVVEIDNSHWLIQAPSQSMRPAYKGSVWLEARTFEVLRIEMQTRRMPKEFPLDKVESAVDYDYVRIGDNKFLLPVHAENLACVRGTPDCTRNVIDFRNYRKYAGESIITFGDSTITYDKQ